MSDEKHTESQRPVTTRHELEARIVARAWQDPKYKERLLAHPTEVVKEAIHAADPSIKLPEHFAVHVHEESSGAYHIVLPRDPRETSPAAGHDLEGAALRPVGALRMG